MTHDEQLRVPLIDLGALHTPLRERLLQRMAEVFDTGRFILGAEVRAFETEVARHLDVPHAIGVSNGTDAIVCALTAGGIGPADTIVTTPFSFVATATACLRTGARLRFVDIDPVHFNLCPTKLAASAIHDVRALVAVHLFGHPADASALSRCVPDALLVEDAAQAFGARAAGRPVGGLGHMGTFSFFPGKPLGALGDGGLVTTRDATFDERVRGLRSHGRGPDGSVHWLGGNYRLDELQAAVLRIKLQDDDERRRLRTQNAEYYRSALAQIPEVIAPQAVGDVVHAWSVFALRVLERRDPLRAHLASAGIETALYYPRPLHLEPALKQQGYARGDFPVAERCSEQLLALPVHAELSAQQRAHVAASIARFFGHSPPE